MKPLVLHIYEKHPAMDAYFFRGSYVPCAIIAVAKRLADAELAAEYHAQQMEAARAVDRAYPWGESDETEIETARIYVLHRFATLPHFDED